MSALSKAFFERDLSAAEEEALAAELEQSDEACAEFAAVAEEDYRKSGFAAPNAAQPKRLRWMAGGALLALGLAWAAWPTADRHPVLTAAVEEKAYEEQVQAPVRPKPAAVQAEAPQHDRLDVTPQGSGFVLTVKLASGGDSRLELRDLQGRVLRSLYSGPLEAGTWAFRWDGTGMDGRALMPGQYRLAWARGDEVLRKTVQVEAR